MSQIRLEKGHYEIPSTYRGMIIKTKSWDYALESPDNHLEAAKALMENWEMKEYNPGMKIVSMGWDHDHYYFIVS